MHDCAGGHSPLLLVPRQPPTSSKQPTEPTYTHVEVGSWYKAMLHCVGYLLDGAHCVGYLLDPRAGKGRRLYGGGREHTLEEFADVLAGKAGMCMSPPLLHPVPTTPAATSPNFRSSPPSHNCDSGLFSTVIQRRARNWRYKETRSVGMQRQSLTTAGKPEGTHTS